MGTVNGWLLPKGSHVEPIEVVVSDEAGAIASMIGCNLIDAVRIDVSSSGGERQVLVGYIDDEGLMAAEGVGDINFLASYLFGRPDPLVGDVLVVAGMSDDGVYDGENYGLPEWILVGAESIVNEAASMYNEFVTSLSAVALAVGEGLIEEREIEDAVDHSDMGELLKTSLRYMEMRIEQMERGEEVPDFDEGMRIMLEQEEGNK